MTSQSFGKDYCWSEAAAARAAITADKAATLAAVVTILGYYKHSLHPRHHFLRCRVDGAALGQFIIMGVASTVSAVVVILGAEASEASTTVVFRVPLANPLARLDLYFGW